jgi:hypothetical protein
VSAQIIRALDKRADELEQEADKIERGVISAQPHRDAEKLRFLAEEFRSLTREAQGY